MIINLTAKNCKTLIDNNRYIYDDMANKLDAFLIKDRINLEEYNILMKLLQDKKE